MNTFRKLKRRLIPHSVEMIWWELWYGGLGRIDAIGHKLRHPSHNVQWRAYGCCIECLTCDRTFWCRCGQWNNALGVWLCGQLGHQWNDGTGWRRSVGWDDVKDEPIYEDLPPQRPTCERCFTDKPVV